MIYVRAGGSSGPGGSIDENARGEFAKFQLLLFGVIAFIVSIFTSCNETRYVIWGKTVDTAVFSKQSFSGGRGQQPYLEVKYQFDDAGKARKEVDEVDPDFTFTSPVVVTIEYIPGTESSRVDGHHQKWWFGVLLASVALMAAGAVKFWRFYKS